MAAERKRGQNADFAAGILPLNIRGGIALRITELLCQLEGFIKAHFFGDHLR